MNLEFVLTTDLEKAVPKEIGFNFEQLKAALPAMLEQYNGLVVTEETVPSAKKDRAALNKLKEAVEGQRKEVKKACMRPYEEFEVKAKQITGLIDAPIRSIDRQLKEFEERRKLEKREKIEAAYNIQIGDLAGLVSLDRFWSEKWLNATVPLASVEQELGDKIFKAQKDIQIIKAMREDCETQMMDTYLHTLDLSAALAEKQRFEELQERLRAQKAAESARAEQRAECERREPQEAAPPPEPSAPVLETLDFRVWVTPEQKRALRNFLIENNIKYGRVQ